MNRPFLKKTAFALLALIPVVSLSGCGSLTSAFSSTKPVEKSRFLLNTDCHITIYDKVDDSVFDRAFSRISDIERKMTVNAETSEIIELNKAAGKHEVKVSEDTFNVLQKGLYYSELSGGKFDITVGPVVKLWNINTPEAAIPGENELKEAVKHIDYRKLRLDEDRLTARLDEEGMEVDLGGVAKGYAADEVEKVLAENGVRHAIINLGGNVLTMGAKPNGDPWRVGIQNPSTPRGDYVGTVKLVNQTAVTSGIYERFFEKGGKVYHHIMDVETGYPVDNELESVTVIADKSSNGDGMSGVLFQLGVEEGMELAAKLEGVEAVFVTKDRKIYVTDGLKNNFALDNTQFTWVNPN